MKSIKQLVSAATKARKMAYAPYSQFKVGAALEAANGKVYTGCNVDNASFGASVCAERVALFKAISDGVRKFKRLVVVAGSESPCSPCGICRQTFFEFAPDLEVVMLNLKGEMKILPLRELFSHAFSAKHLA